MMRSALKHLKMLKSGNKIKLTSCRWAGRAAIDIQEWWVVFGGSYQYSLLYVFRIGLSLNNPTPQTIASPMWRDGEDISLLCPERPRFPSLFSYFLTCLADLRRFLKIFGHFARKTLFCQHSFIKTNWRLHHSDHQAFFDPKGIHRLTSPSR